MGVVFIFKWKQTERPVAGLIIRCLLPNFVGPINGSSIRNVTPGSNVDITDLTLASVLLNVMLLLLGKFSKKQGHALIKFCNKCQMKEDWENFTQLQKTLLLPSNFVTIESSMKLQTQLANLSTDAGVAIRWRNFANFELSF